MGKKKLYYLDPDERKWKMEDLSSHWGSQSHDEQSTMNKVYLLRNRRMIEWSDLLNHCLHCLGTLGYNEEYDSFYCVECDEWRESVCEDEDCEYCQMRPLKPSDCFPKGDNNY